MTANTVSTPSAAPKRAGMGRKKALTALNYTLTYAFMIFMAAVVIIPILYMFGLSVDANGDMYRTSFLPREISFEHIVFLFKDTPFLKWYGNTITLGIFNALFIVLLVTPTAYAFSKLRFRGRKNYLMLFLVMQMFPGSMAMMAYYVLLNMFNLVSTLGGLLLVFSCAAVPGSVFMVKGFLDTIPTSLEEAAKLDGATRLQCIWHIVLPLALPMIGLIAVFGFSAPFGDYMLSSMLIRDTDKYLLALGIHNEFISGIYQNMPAFAAASILAGLPITVIYILLQRMIFFGLRASFTK